MRGISFRACWSLSPRPMSVRTLPRLGVFVGLLVFVCIATSALRFWNLENRGLSEDESISVLHAAGYRETEFHAAFVDSLQHRVAQMRMYQGSAVTRPASAVLQSLALEDPQHPPLYYLMLHEWQRLSGASAAAQRVPSILLGIALVPAMYWLCMELFDCRRTAAIGAALIAASPFFFTYSREIREYILFAFCAIVANALLLRTQKTPTAPLWALYTLSLVIGLYADLFFPLLLVAHALYFFLCGDRKFKLGGIFALLAAIGLFLPWISAYAHYAPITKLVAKGGGADATVAWTAGRWPLKMMVEKWLFNVGTTFFDLEYYKLRLGILLLPIFAALFYSLLHLVRNATQLQRRFLGCLLFATIFLFAASDVILNAHVSVITRYGTLAYVTLLLFMSAMLGFEVGRPRFRSVARGLTVGIVAASVASCVVGAQSSEWWDNHADDEVIPIATRINTVEHPLLIAPSTSYLRVFTLSFRLKDDARVTFPTAGAPRFLPREKAFLVATQAEAADFIKLAKGVRFEPLYLARYSQTWEAFHRPLQRGQLQDADVNKLSLWKIINSEGLVATRSASAAHR